MEKIIACLALLVLLGGCTLDPNSQEERIQKLETLVSMLIEFSDKSKDKLNSHDEQFENYDKMMELSIDNMEVFFDHMKKQDDINGKLAIFMESSNKSQMDLLEMIQSLQSQINSYHGDY